MTTAGRRSVPNQVDAGLPAQLVGPTVAEVAVTTPKTLPADARVDTARHAFDDPHVHLLLLVGAGVLQGTLERGDVPDDAQTSAPALPLAHLDARTVSAGEDLASAHHRMVAAGRRRLAVVGPGGQLLGLLCLRRDGRGFCTDEGVAAREVERTATDNDLYEQNPYSTEGRNDREADSARGRPGPQTTGTHPGDRHGGRRR